MAAYRSKAGRIKPNREKGWPVPSNKVRWKYLLDVQSGSRWVDACVGLIHTSHQD